MTILEIPSEWSQWCLGQGPPLWAMPRTLTLYPKLVALSTNTSTLLIQFKPKFLFKPFFRNCRPLSGLVLKLFPRSSIKGPCRNVSVNYCWKWISKFYKNSLTAVSQWWNISNKKCMRQVGWILIQTRAPGYSGKCFIKLYCFACYGMSASRLYQTSPRCIYIIHIHLSTWNFVVSLFYITS